MRRVIPPADGPMSATDRLRIVAEILSLYARARRDLGRSDLPTTLAALREVRAAPVVAAAERRALGLRLGTVAIRTLRPLPVDTRCLMRSLVLSGLLAARGIDSNLVVAARPGEDFAAHAWVEYEGRPLLEPAGEPFRRLVEL